MVRSRDRRSARFYGEKASPEAAAPPELDLAGAAKLAGLTAEVELLRALVKRAVQLGKDGEARQLLLALCSALRLQARVAGGSAGEGSDVIGELLDEIARDARARPAEPEGRL